MCCTRRLDSKWPFGRRCIYYSRSFCADSGQFNLRWNWTKSSERSLFHHQLSSSRLEIKIWQIIVMTICFRGWGKDLLMFNVPNWSRRGCYRKKIRKKGLNDNIFKFQYVYVIWWGQLGNGNKCSSFMLPLQGTGFSMGRVVRKGAYLANQSLTHHFNEVGIGFEIVLQSVNSQVLFALCLALNQHV